MKCPKCGYHSFDHLESCRKCGRDLGEHKVRYGLSGRAAVEEASPARVAPPPADEVEEAVSFGPDLLLPAPVSLRLAAAGVDGAILALALALFAAAGRAALPTPAEMAGMPTVILLLELSIPCFLLLFALCFGYFTLFHFLAGQTPGKMLCRLRVEGKDGSGLLFSQAFLRSVGGLASLVAGGIGYLRIFFDRQQRGWNDLLAGSRVVRAGAPGEEAKG